MIQSLATAADAKPQMNYSPRVSFSLTNYTIKNYVLTSLASTKNPEIMTYMYRDMKSSNALEGLDKYSL